jgi:hypothetical protein
MPLFRSSILIAATSLAAHCHLFAEPEEPRGELPGELSAEQILNGEYPWPDSPHIDITEVANPHFNPDAFGVAPAPGIHPRILFSPEDLPAIRAKIQDTDIGRLTYANIQQRNALAKKDGTAYSNVYKALLAGKTEEAASLLDDYKNAGSNDGTLWHHRPNFPYILTLECFTALIENDSKKGTELATVVTTLGQVYQGNLDRMDQSFREGSVTDDGIVNKDGNAMKAIGQLNSDVWRSGRRNAIGGEPWFALMYDYTYNWMNAEQQTSNRKVINDYIRGKTAMGSHMPHHFRNWNWIAVGSGLLLTSLATEGEDGNDARVYEHMKEIQTDYIKYGWSTEGSSREAIGYTSFGLLWSGPSMVAMARRGHNMWNWSRWYKSNRWYAHSVQPGDGRFISHGDGGQSGPGAITPLLFKQAYPEDPLVDYVLQQSLAEINKGGDKIDGGRGWAMYQCIFAADPTDVDHHTERQLELEKTFFDTERNSLITRSEFGNDEVQLQFECRSDAFAANHQHSDRGNFTLAGAGRVWAIDRFRGIESRHHNVVTIDYKGQGYFTPPGEWLGLVDNEYATFGACDAKNAYDYYWQTYIAGFADKDQPRRHYKRWENFTKDADAWLTANPDFDWKANIDRTPQVEAYYKGFEFGDPRMWDEYSRPVKVPFNPVQKAFRTAGLVRGAHPYALVIDDIRKDDAPHTYDWNMMVDSDVQLIEVKTDTIVLGSPAESELGNFDVHVPRPKKGDPQLLIKVLHRAIPGDVYHNPQIRLETMEYKDARIWPEGRSFGLAKRLVVPSFTAEPKFKMLLFPHHHGDTVPTTTWNDDQTMLTIAWPDQTDVITFSEDDYGRTHLKIQRGNIEIMNL